MLQLIDLSIVVVVAIRDHATKIFTFGAMISGHTLKDYIKLGHFLPNTYKNK